MKNKIITGAIILAAVLFSIGRYTNAAGEKFYIENYVAQGGTLMGAWTTVDDGTGSLVERLATWNTSGTPYASEQDLMDAAKNAVAAWANTTGGFSGITTDDVYTYIPKLATVAKTGAKSDIGLGNVDNTSDVNKPVSNATQTALDGKQETLVSGTNIKTVNGVSVLGSGNIAFKKVETFSGTTNASGNYTVTFGTSYSVAPNIQANIINATDTQNIRITSISTTGFTVLVRNRTDVAGLLPTYSNVSGASVDVLITEK